MSLRRHIVFAPVLGEQRVHVTVDIEAGKPVGVWLDQNKVGSYGRETHHALARVASLALGAGVAVDLVADALLGTEGGPCGDVTDCDGITTATSVADLVGQIFMLPASS